MPPQPFEVSFETLKANLDQYVEVVFSLLESDFITMPKGPGFIEYPVFEDGYEDLKRATNGFASFNPESITRAVVEKPMIFIVLRTILGFTPPEWAYMSSRHLKVAISQEQARSLDRKIRLAPSSPLNLNPEVLNRLKTMLRTACLILDKSVSIKKSDRLHRLDKADTRSGLIGLQNLASLGVPYAMLLYERLLGRPFAGHRDSVSELVGDVLETAIEDGLTKAKISFRKTRRAERLPGFDQAPDFILPDEFNPRTVIEAKITEDDRTARDKVTRIQYLAELGRQAAGIKGQGFAVIACIGGRGFGVRREDMRKLLLATQGKVFTLKTIRSLSTLLK